MTLLIEVLGVVVVAVLLGERLGPRRSLVPGVLAVAVAIAALSSFPVLWSDAHTLVNTHDQDAMLTREAANTAAGGTFPANEPFLAFAEANIPRSASVYLDCGTANAGCPGGLNEWISFRLTPRLFLPTPARARYALFYGANPATAAYARGWRVLGFGANLAVAVRP